MASSSSSSSSPLGYLFGSSSSTGTPALHPRFRNMKAVDETRFKRAKFRKFAGLSHGMTKDCNSYSFCQLADTQFGMLPEVSSLQWLRYLRKVIEIATCGRKKGKSVIPVPLLAPVNGHLDADALLELEIELSRRAVEAINAMNPKPKFVVVCGDLTNAFPEKNADLHNQQVKIFKEVFSQIHKDIPLVCVCGNHDIGDSPTPETLQKWQGNYGDDYFSFWVGPDKFIVLNSQLYKDPKNCIAEAKAQDRWLDNELFDDSNPKPRHIVVFSHIPPFINDPEEPSGYFPLAKKVRLNLLERMDRAGVKYWFAGHYHRNAQGKYKNLNVVTTAAVGGNLTTDKAGDPLGLSGMGMILGSDQLSGFRVVEMSASGISQEFKTLQELDDGKDNHIKKNNELGDMDMKTTTTTTTTTPLMNHLANVVSKSK